VDELVRELPERPPVPAVAAAAAAAAAASSASAHELVAFAKADYQPTVLPKMRWRTPHYVRLHAVASPVWSALS